MKYVKISEYKNLKDFEITFDSDNFIDVFVGKNGSGKSNFFEALIEILNHILESKIKAAPIGFSYEIIYEVHGFPQQIIWDQEQFTINKKQRKASGKFPFPDNILIYYSGHNKTIETLVEKSIKNFLPKTKKVSETPPRLFYGIDSTYKDLFLFSLLFKVNTPAYNYICEKLNITKTADTFVLTLKRPAFANTRLKELGFEQVDKFDRRSFFWGADGVTKDFLFHLYECIKGEFQHSDVYSQDNDEYVMSIDLALFRSKYTQFFSADIFRRFDNLKILDMISEIDFPLTIDGVGESTSASFSDGQFQLVYIYAAMELFKHRECLTLLDEPDAFLHPEWQYQFLDQVFEIAEENQELNHILMSSHSAVTLIQHQNAKVRYFDVKDDKATCYNVPKHVAVKKLSSDIIKYSEDDQILSIINTIQIENKPVLFTEGNTDPIVIKQAWYKLYEDEMPFIPFYAFSCTYLSQLLSDERIVAEMQGLPVFGLYDFDKAYNQWNGMNGSIIEQDPYKGLIKKWEHGESYALMLPVPVNADIQNQVIKNSATKETFKDGSCCEMEHLFYGSTVTQDYFKQESCVGGTRVEFCSDSDKTDFAKTVVPCVEDEYFEVFRPMFEFIKEKSLMGVGG
ncbi:MAG: AAA family ATPase [Fibrobacterales bacterium]